MDLKVAIEEVDSGFNRSLPLVWLHYNVVEGHFEYYSERCPPRREGWVVRLPDSSSDESPSPKPGPKSNANKVASDYLGKVVQSQLHGMNAKHHFRNLERISIS